MEVMEVMEMLELVVRAIFRPISLVFQTFTCFANLQDGVQVIGARTGKVQILAVGPLAPT